MVYHYEVVGLSSEVSGSYLSFFKIELFCATGQIVLEKYNIIRCVYILTAFIVQILFMKSSNENSVLPCYGNAIYEFWK